MIVPKRSQIERNTLGLYCARTIYISTKQHSKEIHSGISLCRYLNMWKRWFSTNFYFSFTLTPRQVAWAPVRRQDHNSEDNHHCRHKVFGQRDDN